MVACHPPFTRRGDNKPAPAADKPSFAFADTPLYGFNATPHTVTAFAGRFLPLAGGRLGGGSGAGRTDVANAGTHPHPSLPPQRGKEQEAYRAGPVMRGAGDLGLQSESASKEGVSLACEPKFGSWNRQGTKNAKRNIVLELLLGYSPDSGAVWLNNPMTTLAPLAFLAV
jgi:hypothetical protein